MAGRRKRSHSVSDQPKLKLQRSVMTSMVDNEKISKNKDKNHDSSVITHTVVLSERKYRFITVYRPPEFNLADVFLDFCVQRGLHQMVKECTRDNSCVDLVLVSDVSMVFNMNVQTPFSTSDHCMVDYYLIRPALMTGVHLWSTIMIMIMQIYNPWLTCYGITRLIVKFGLNT